MSQIGQDIPEDLNNCPVAELEHPHFRSSRLRKLALFFALLSCNFALLCGGFYLPVIALGLGITALLLTVFDYRKTKSVFYTGVVLGFLGLIFGSFTFSSSIINHKRALNATSHYKNELAIPLPNLVPNYYFITFGIYASMNNLPRREFHYLLEEEDNNTFNNAIKGDERWLDLPFNLEMMSFLNKFNLDLHYSGQYLLYNRLNKQFGAINDFENYQKDYYFVLVIYDYEARTLVIYELYS